MRDFENTKGGNMVIDEIGLKLVEKLSEGPWTEDKEMSLKEEISFNRDYREKFRNVQLRLIPSVALSDALTGFVSSLDSSKVEKLKQPVLSGLSSFIDALVDLFQKDYLPSVEQPEDKELLCEEKIHATRFKNIISNMIHERGIDVSLKKLWGEATDLKLVNEHYCHLLLKNEEELYNNIKEHAKEANWSITWTILEHFKSYVEKGRNITDRSKFFELFDDKSAREKIFWGNRIEEFKKIIEEKLRKYFSDISDFVQLDKLEELLMAKYKVQFTGKKGKEFIMGYAFENKESFKDWSFRIEVDYINKQFENILSDKLSIQSLENSILKNDYNYYVLSKKIIELFNILQIDRYIKKELDEKIDLTLIYQHYCRLLSNDKPGNTATRNIVIAIVLHFIRVYICQAKKCEDINDFYKLLANQDERRKVLWEDNRDQYEIIVEEYLRDVFDSLYLKVDLGIDKVFVMEKLKSYFAKDADKVNSQDNDLWFIQKYDFKNRLEDWISEKSKDIAKQKCSSFVYNILPDRLSCYYCSSEIDSKDRFLRMKTLAKDYILSSELNDEVRDKWEMKDNEDTSMVYDHYFYTLVNGRIYKKTTQKDDPQKQRVSFENVLNEFKNNKERKQDFKMALKDSFLKYFRNYLDVGRKRMKDEKNRSQFFSLINDETARGQYLWTKSWKDYQKEIKEAVKDAYQLLVFPDGFNSKEKVFCPQLKVIAKTLIETKEGFKSMLTGDGGWALVMNYSFRQDITKWRDDIIHNYIVEKPRIIILLQADRFALRTYLTRDEKLNKNFLKLYNSYSRLDGSIKSFIEKGEHTDVSIFLKHREDVLKEEDAINEFVCYFYGWKDGAPNAVRRCESELGSFRFESQLSTWLYSALKNFFISRVKKEYDNWKIDKNRPFIQQEDGFYEKIGVRRNQNLAIITKQEEIPNLEIVIKSALVNHAWLFFDFRKDDFGKVTEMNASLIQLVKNDRNWKFFYTMIDDLKNNIKTIIIKKVQNMENQDVKVLPKLIAYCHVLYSRCYNSEGKKVDNHSEKTDYSLLMQFYGVKDFTIRAWCKRAKEELKEKVSPFIDGFIKEIASLEAGLEVSERSEFVENIMIRIPDILNGIPLYLNEMSHLFLPDSKEVSRYRVIQSDEKRIVKRDSLQVNKVNLNTKQPRLTDGGIIRNYIIRDLDPKLLAKDLEDRLWKSNRK